MERILAAAAEDPIYAPHIQELTRLGMPALWEHIIQALQPHALAWLDLQLPAVQQQLSDAAGRLSAMPEEDSSLSLPAVMQAARAKVSRVLAGAWHSYILDHSLGVHLPS